MTVLSESANSPRWLEDRRLEGRPTFIFGREEDLMQVPDEIRKCVAFALSKTKDGLYLRGTIFFVEEPLRYGGRVLFWWVTAAHVINKVRSESIDGKVWIRLNLADGTSRVVATDISAWVIHADKDVAVLSRPLGLPFDHLFYPLSPQLKPPDDLALGDEVLFVGLFSGHPGNVRNVPIVRVGNIAAMPGEPINLKSWGKMVAYLVEARSIGGLSGAPVFAYFGPTRARPGGGVVLAGNRPALHLLGVMHGHFDASERDGADASDDADEKGREVVNMGIGIVVPIEAVIELFNTPSTLESKARLRREWEEQ
jgi:hypothetical protein